MAARAGSILGDVLNNGTFAINRSDMFVFGGVISGTGALQQNGAGMTMLTDTNTYTGATVVNAGALIVNGSIASSSGLTVNPGGYARRHRHSAEHDDQRRHALARQFDRHDHGQGT